MKKNNANGLNGSVGRLALALKDVFTDALEPINERLESLEEGLGTVREEMGTLHKNVQAQLSQHRKAVSGDIRQILRSKRP